METEEIRAGKFGWDQGGTLNSVVFVFGSNSNYLVFLILEKVTGIFCGKL